MRKRIASARGDLTGDGAAETLILSGEQSAGSAYWQNIELEITDGRTGRTARVPLAHDGGYDPQLVLGSMTARDRVDALIALETGSSGAVGLYSVVAYQNGAYQTVFDSEQYAKRMRYRVQYLDQYVVRAESENTGMAYFIDLAGKDGDYLAQLYDENGVLRQPQMGFVDPVSLLYPADVNRDGLLELVAWQKISGLYHADALGDFITTLAWNGRAFAPTTQTVGILGYSKFSEKNF